MFRLSNAWDHLLFQAYPTRSVFSLPTFLLIEIQTWLFSSFELSIAIAAREQSKKLEKQNCKCIFWSTKTNKFGQRLPWAFSMRRNSDCRTTVVDKMQMRLGGLYHGLSACDAMQIVTRRRWAKFRSSPRSPLVQNAWDSYTGIRLTCWSDREVRGGGAIIRSKPQQKLIRYVSEIEIQKWYSGTRC